MHRYDIGQLKRFNIFRFKIKMDNIIIISDLIFNGFVFININN